MAFLFFECSNLPSVRILKERILNTDRYTVLNFVFPVCQDGAPHCVTSTSFSDHFRNSARKRGLTPQYIIISPHRDPNPGRSIR
jgi:hypothetical protein